MVPASAGKGGGVAKPTPALRMNNPFWLHQAVVVAIRTGDVVVPLNKHLRQGRAQREAASVQRLIEQNAEREILRAEVRPRFIK